MVSHSLSTKAQRARALKLITKAYLIAYFSVAGPKIFRTAWRYLRGRYTQTEASEKLERIFKRAVQSNQLPAFALVLASGSKLLQPLLTIILGKAYVATGRQYRLTDLQLNRFTRFTATLVSSAVAFSLLNGPAYGPKVKAEYGKTVTFDLDFTDDEDDGTSRRKPKRSKIPPGLPPVPYDSSASSTGVLMTRGIPLAGQTMDLTVFAAIRAMDALVQLPRDSNKPARNGLAALARRTGTPLLFIISSAVIMNAWFYTPQRLPISYDKWIGRIAELDERLLYCLRQIRYGNFIYGKDTGMAPALGSMAKDCGLPYEYGDPAKTIPCPCELVHHGVSKSCEYHALWRFYRGWKKALGVYMPLQTILLLRKMRQRRCGRGRAAVDAVSNAARNSAFLGAFVSLMYYGVCLGRTRLGPKLFPKVSPGQWDGGLAILWGCALCGFSVLLENARRQTELMLFVVPRAAAVAAPRRYAKDLLWREQAVFALSAAVVLTVAAEKPQKIRGVLGGILGSLAR